MIDNAQSKVVLSYHTSDESPAFVNRRNLACICISLGGASHLLFVLSLYFEWQLRYGFFAVAASFGAVILALFFASQTKRSRGRTILLIVGALQLFCSFVLLLLLMAAMALAGIGAGID